MDALIAGQSIRTTGPTSRSGARLNVLFGVASWGLGHATRDLPLISRMLDCGHQVTVASSGRALSVLKQELSGRCTFLEWPDLPIKISKSAPLFYARWTLSLPLALRAMIAENRALHGLLNVEHFDRIVSDSRFGVRSSRVASFHLTHGMRMIAPRRNPLLEVTMEYIFRSCYGRGARFIVPDFASGSLSGELSHDLRFIPADQMSYIGILSGVRRRPVSEDIDCYVSISGPEPQRTILERIILDQVYDLPGRTVVSLGKPDESAQSWRRGNVTIYSYVNRRQQEELMNRARLVVSRSGYSTIMELAELRKRALLIPTPGQTEQEYLAGLHLRLGNFYSVTQRRLDLARDVEVARDYPGCTPTHCTDQTIEQFMQLLAD